MELDQQLDTLRGELTSHKEEELIRDTVMSEKMDALALQMKTLEEQVTTLLNLWEQARGMLTLIKWMSATAGFFASLFYYLKTRL